MSKVNLTLSGIGGMEVITLGTSVAKAKSKTILVQMMSAAGTGYAFNTKRNRLREKLVMRKHDPFVNKHVLFFEKRKIKSI